MNVTSNQLLHNKQHFDSCHARWMKRRNRKQEDPKYKEEWYAEQCLMCKYFIPLTGVFIEDYGACSNPSSAFDGVIRFEHDGCIEFFPIDDTD